MSHEWVSFRDGEAVVPDRLLFEGRVAGRRSSTADGDGSVTCPYVLFYQAVRPQPHVVNLESLLSETEKCAKQEENRPFKLAQVLCSGLPARAVIQLNGFDITSDYFIKIHCHSR
jgi:hypothetical protein